jgi:hypothetical protein
LTKRVKILLIILLLTLTSTMSCSTFLSYAEYKQGIDKELEYYVDYVKQLSSDFSKVDSVTFYYHAPKDLNKSYTVGFCSFSLTHWKNYIKINTFWWNKASDRERVILIAHELKHCSCIGNWMHINREDKSLCRVNYMSSSIPNSFCIGLYYSDYIEQIKRGCDDR